MSQIDAVQKYLERIGQLSPLSLDDKIVAATENDSAFLIDSLSSQQKLNNGLLICAVIILYGLFAVGVWLVWYYRSTPSTILYVLGGNLFSLIAIVRWLRQLWLEKNVTDVFIRAARNLSPEQTANLITTYYNLMMRRSATSPSPTPAVRSS